MRATERIEARILDASNVLVASPEAEGGGEGETC